MLTFLYNISGTISAANSCPTSPRGAGSSGRRHADLGLVAHYAVLADQARPNSNGTAVSGHSRIQLLFRIMQNVESSAIFLQRNKDFC